MRHDGDDLQKSILRQRYSRFHRRKRSVLGKDWAPPTLQDVTKGVWCSRCRMRHPYNGNGKVGADYEYRGGILVLLWLCPNTLDVIGELWCTASREKNGT